MVGGIMETKPTPQVGEHMSDTTDARREALAALMDTAFNDRGTKPDECDIDDPRRMLAVLAVVERELVEPLRAELAQARARLFVSTPTDEARADLAREKSAREAADAKHRSSSIGWINAATKLRDRAEAAEAASAAAVETLRRLQRARAEEDGDEEAAQWDFVDAFLASLPAPAPVTRESQAGNWSECSIEIPVDTELLGLELPTFPPGAYIKINAAPDSTIRNEGAAVPAQQPENGTVGGSTVQEASPAYLSPPSPRGDSTSAALHVHRWVAAQHAWGCTAGGMGRGGRCYRAASVRCEDRACLERGVATGRCPEHEEKAPAAPPPEASPAGTTCGRMYVPDDNAGLLFATRLNNHRHCTKDAGHGDPCGKKEGRT